MNQVIKQHKQHVENHFKFSRCAGIFKLAKLKCKSQKYSRHQIRQNAEAKRRLKKNNEESIQFNCSIVVIMVIERANTGL